MTDKIALVTGAGSGIGRESALALAKGGFDVVLVGRRREPLQEVASEIEALGRRAFVKPADLGKPEEARAVFAAVKAECGRLDVVFNNAGRGAPAVPIEELPLETFQSVVDLNLTAIFICTQEAFKIMKDQTPRGGRIINNGSISAHAPRPFSIAYTATKHAVTGLTKSTSLDGRAYDIACGQVDVGNADTAMGGRMKAGVPQADGSIRAEAVMNPADVGSAVAYMASLPIDTNVQFLTIMATKMPFVGRG